MVKTKHKLITASWTADVEALETGIGRFSEDRTHPNDCEVVFFEIDGDGRLHVNVTHRHQTTTVAGWAGPASLREGFVHNRTFGDTPPGQLLRAIRNMVLAERI